MPSNKVKASCILKTASKTLYYPKRNKRMLEKKKATVQEGIEVLSKFLATDIRIAPDFEASKLKSRLDAIETDINVLDLSMPFQGTIQYDEYKNEVIECNELLSKARKLLSEVRSKYSIQ